MAAKKSSETVFVYANLPNGQSFRISAGRTVTLEGYPVSKLVDDMGNALPAGQYGITELPAEDWQQVEKLYGQLTVMQSGIIFTAQSREQGDAMAAERCGLRHGVEPIDPATTATKPLEVDKE
ncbi:MAG: hypothetical protein RRY29_03815 [Desulfovibrionaceae bacterium]